MDPQDIKGRVLVVDDDEGIVQALTARLENAGYECLPALSSRQGLALFDRGGVDLVITDMHMPGHDGVALSERICSRSSVPIIFMSAHPGLYEESTEHLAQTFPVVSKPFAWEEMNELLASELVLYRERCEEREARRRLKRA